MSVKKYLYFAVALILFSFMTPLAALAQPMTSGFTGTVSAGGLGLPDGSEVSAWIDGSKVAETTTENSTYYLPVSGNYSGKTVSFKIGQFETAQTAEWKQGENTNLDLSINSWPYRCDFYGLVTIDGTHVPDGTEVSAWIDSAKVQSTTTIGSLYSMAVPGNYTGKNVTFKVGADFATQIASWQRGSELEVNLTVSLGPSVCGFYGPVKLDDEAPADGTEVSAWIDSARVQSTLVTNGRYALNISGNRNGKTVAFKVNGEPAAETPLWVRGENQQVPLTANTVRPPLVTISPSSQSIRPGQVLTLTINVDPNGNGISSGEIEILPTDSSVFEVLVDHENTAPGNLLGSDVIEGVKEKTSSGEGERFNYALARKGTTPTPTNEAPLATIAIRVKPSAKPGQYAIPNVISLTNERFEGVDFTPPVISVEVSSGLIGDIDEDGIVGLSDLAILASAYATAYGEDGYLGEADLDGNDEIGLGDLALLARNWG